MDARAASREPTDAARAELARAVRDLHPAYFALVMATGIVSIASHALGFQFPARVLLWLNLAAYAALATLFVTRAFLFTRHFAADLRSHQRGPGFFTAVAATCVVGLQLAILRGDLRAASALWLLGVVLWCVCTYGIFVLLSVGEPKPSLGEGINGGWLLAVVATQSVCVLGSVVLPARYPLSEVVFLALASLWLCGGMLYIWMISLIFYRYMFFRFSPSDLLPPYWINMGAVAISVVAGTGLAAAAPDSSLLTRILPFVNGFTVMFWATATWWIPMLVLLGAWRHGLSRVRIAYDPLYWGLVFPLGMYSVATLRVGKLFGVPLLLVVARGFGIVALCAWALTFAGLTARLVRLCGAGIRAMQPQSAARSSGR